MIEQKWRFNMANTNCIRAPTKRTIWRINTQYFPAHLNLSKTNNGEHDCVFIYFNEHQILISFVIIEQALFGILPFRVSLKLCSPWILFLNHHPNRPDTDVGFAALKQSPWRKWSWEDVRRSKTLPSGYLTVRGKCPFIDGLPIKNGDFPWLC